MLDQTTTFRGKRCADMSLEDLREIRELISHNGAWYDSRAEHMQMLTVVDEHIEAARKRRSYPEFPEG